MYILKIILLLLTLSTINIHSQIFKGNVAIFDKGVYTMGEKESWVRVNVNGGLNYNRKGYINFEDSAIIFVIGSTTSEEEIYNLYRFKNENMKKTSVLYGSGIISEEFFLLDSDNSTVVLTYIPGRYFTNNKGVFVFELFKKQLMYFLAPLEDATKGLKNVYAN